MYHSRRHHTNSMHAADSGRNLCLPRVFQPASLLILLLSGLFRRISYTCTHSQIKHYQLTMAWHLRSNRLKSVAIGVAIGREKKKSSLRLYAKDPRRMTDHGKTKKVQEPRLLLLLLPRLMRPSPPLQLLRPVQLPLVLPSTPQSPPP